MNKTILIVIPGFRIGGTTSSLLALLPELEKANISVDIFCLSHKGPLKEVFQKYNVLDENIWLSNEIIDASIVKKLMNFFVQSFRRICRRFFNVDLYKLFGKIGGRQIHSIDYDAVASFQEDLSRVIVGYPTNNRIAWIRAEYKRYINETGRNEKKLYESFDRIVCVSKFAKDSFCSIYPQFEKKVSVIHNVIAEKEIKELAKEVFSDEMFDTSDFTIVSIGRIDPVKQFEMIPKIASDIKTNTNLPFKWFIIGDGEKSIIELLKKSIINYNVKENVFLLGQKKNVYPFIVNANLLVHTSKSETFSRVVNDAKVLGTPVMINTYGCANEFVKDGFDGFIVPVSAMGYKISELMTEKKLLFEIKQNLGESKADNDTIINQIKELV